MGYILKYVDFILEEIFAIKYYGTIQPTVEKTSKPKLYTPSTPNIDFIQWHTIWIVCAVK